MSADDPLEPSTRTLLRRGRAGDLNALDRVFARIHAAVRRWARGRVPRGTRSVAETHDFVQDAAVGVWKQIDHVQLQMPGDLEAYIRTAVRNRILDEARRLQRQPESTTANSAIPTALPSALDELMNAELWQRYRAALSQLTREEQEAVIARFEMGYSYEQVAAVLNKSSAAAARMAVNRALARLKTIAATTSR